MPKLAANLSTMFCELALEDRPAAALDAGFKGIEFKFFDQPPSAKLLKEVASRGLEVVLFNANPGDLAGGEIGLASLPEQRERFEHLFLRDLELAGRIGAANMHVMAGRSRSQVSPPEQMAAAIDAYGWAAERACGAGVVLLIEPLAPVAVAGYFINSLALAHELVDEVGSSHFKILFDFYHMQLAGGDISGRFSALQPQIAHTQIAATPSRMEPDEGELCVGFLFDALDQMNYSGWVGCEYTPRSSTLAGLGWAKNWLW